MIVMLTSINYNLNLKGLFLAEIKAQFNYNNRLSLEDNLPLGTPLVVYIEPSSFCNLECKFCPQHTGKDEFPKFNMSLEIFEKTLDDISKFDKKPSLMRFCGIGDPLFNKQISEIVKKASLSNVIDKTELITNGILLNEERIKSFAEYLGRIIISVEGLSEEDYMNFALRKINFEKFLSNIRKFFNTKNRKCKIHIKIHNQAVETPERKEKFFDIFEPICDEIFIENLVDLWPEKKSNLGLDVGHRFESTMPPEAKVCPQIFKSMQVNADGRVLPCCVDWKSINIIGDIKKTNLKDIWHDEPLRKLQKKHLLGERNTFSPCKGCSHNEYSEKDNLDNHAKIIYKKMFGNN